MTGIEYKPYVIDAGYLFPPSLADFLGAEDEVHLFREVTEHPDVGCLDSEFNGMGQHPYHPRLLLRLLMWGMANRIVSTRRIEVLARRDVSFIYLAGGQRPDFRTLTRFRRWNARAIKSLFKETVLLCARLGMVNLGHIALDETKLKASASKHKAMSYGRMKQEEERIERSLWESWANSPNLLMTACLYWMKSSHQGWAWVTSWCTRRHIFSMALSQGA